MVSKDLKETANAIYIGCGLVFALIFVTTLVVYVGAPDKVFNTMKLTYFISAGITGVLAILGYIISHISR